MCSRKTAPLWKNQMANPQFNTQARDQAKRDEQDHKAAEAARAVTNEVAKVGEQSARAGADLARRGAETARDSLQSGVNMATQGFQRINDQFTKALGFDGPQAEELARRSSQNLQAVSQANTVLARGFQDASHEWISLAQERATKNIDALNRLAGCRSVQDFVAVQSDLVRDNLWQIIDTNKRIAELSLRVAEEAAGIVQMQVDKTADAARRVAH
jgi:hypothetical protein